MKFEPCYHCAGLRIFVPRYDPCGARASLQASIFNAASTTEFNIRTNATYDRINMPVRDSIPSERQCVSSSGNNAMIMVRTLWDLESRWPCLEVHRNKDSSQSSRAIPWTGQVEMRMPKSSDRLECNLPQDEQQHCAALLVRKG